MIDFKEVLFLCVVTLANIMEGITGFAGTMLAMPLSMILLGVQPAKSILNIVAIIVSSLIFFSTYKDINKKELFKIVVFMVIGMGGGIYLFSVFPASGLAKIYGVLIILISLKGLFIKKEFRLSNVALTFVVLIAGIIHGMFLSGGALLIIYAVSVLKDKYTIRATLAPVWMILNSYILLQDLYVGNITPQVSRLIIYSIIPLLLAVALGNYLHKKMNQKFFIKLTYFLLIISGITLLF
ncbi:MAG: sulfite exporter TauE/SafE family protein [Clostridium sp.]|nr:sulfite exporter TauE/SafE family protein [Clostridium sp.]